MSNIANRIGVKQGISIQGKLSTKKQGFSRSGVWITSGCKFYDTLGYIWAKVVVVASLLVNRTSR